MKVKFKDGITRGCTNPTEQKQFRNGEAIGWGCAFAILGNLTSSQVDEMATSDNFSVMTFISDEGNELFVIEGYNRLVSAVVRHAEQNGSVELQLSKGV